MPKFSVDVKAFIKVEVEAENPTAARRAAEVFVDALSPTEPYVAGWNAEGSKGKVIEGGCFDIDGDSDVSQLCPECGDELGVDGENGVCALCVPEPEEPPLDTPSLDTSFHDYEMDVG